MSDDSKHIDSTEKALEVGIERVRHLPHPLEKETSEKPVSYTHLRAHET